MITYRNLLEIFGRWRTVVEIGDCGWSFVDHQQSSVGVHSWQIVIVLVRRRTIDGRIPVVFLLDAGVRVPGVIAMHPRQLSRTADRAHCQEIQRPADDHVIVERNVKCHQDGTESDPCALCFENKTIIVGNFILSRHVFLDHCGQVTAVLF